MFTYIDDPGYPARDGGVCHEKDPDITFVPLTAVPRQPARVENGAGKGEEERVDDVNFNAIPPGIEAMVLAATVKAIAKDPHSFDDSAIVGVDEQLASRGFEPVFTSFPAIQYAGTEETVIVSRPLATHPIHDIPA